MIDRPINSAFSTVKSFSPGYIYPLLTASIFFWIASPTWTTPTTGTVTGSGSATQVAFWDGNTSLSGNNQLYWDNTNGCLGINDSTPGARLKVLGEESDTSIYTVDINHVRNDTNVATHAMRLNVDLSGADTTTADRTNSGLLIDIDSTANGDATHEHRIYGVNTTINFTGFTDLARGGYFLAESNYTGAKTSQLVGVYGNAVHDVNDVAGGVSNMYGVYGTSSIQDKGDVDNAYGGFFNVVIPNSRTENVGATIGVQGEVQIDKETALTYGTMIGVSSVIDNNETTFPTFGNQYLFKGDYQGDKGSNAYGLFIEGDKHYLAGKLGLNNTDPTYRLDVTGSARVTGAFYDSNDSPGASGQVLSSTVTGTDWVGGGGLPGGPYLPLAAGSGSPLTGTLYGTSTNFSGSGDYEGSMVLGNGVSTAEAHLTIGQARTDNGYSYIDLVGDATYTDYGLRIIRSNTGENTTSGIYHRGTGNLEIQATDSASILLKTDNTLALTLNSSQNATFAGNVGIGDEPDENGFGLEIHKDGSSDSIGVLIHNKGTNALDDAKISFETQGSMDYSIGIDRSDSNKFKISRAGDFGTNDTLTLATDNSATFAGLVKTTQLEIESTVPSILFDETDVTARWRNRVQTGGYRLQYASDGSTFTDHVSLGANAFTLAKDTTFTEQAFSAATSSGDGSSTLTTKGYVDSLITGATIYRGTWQAGISATSTGTTSSSTTLTVSAAILDAAGNTPTLVGAVVTGAGITGTVKVASVTSSTIYELDTAISATASAYIFSPIYGAPDLSGVTQTSGYYYICSEAGSATPNGAGTEPNTWGVGDWVIWNDDVGTSGEWQKVDNSSVLSGVGTGQTVALWEGASSVTDSETLGNAPITVSGNDTTFANSVTVGHDLKMPTNGEIDWNAGAVKLIGTADDIKLQGGSLSITGDGSNAVTLTESGSGDFTIDAPDDIRLDAGGGDVVLKSAGTEFGRISKSSNDLSITSSVTNSDILLIPNGTGNVGIGTSNPGAKLHVVSADLGGTNNDTTTLRNITRC